MVARYRCPAPALRRSGYTGSGSGVQPSLRGLPAGQLPNAPVRGDEAAWAPRLAQGMDTLVQHVTQGFKAMPTRGLCMDCSTEDYQAVIELMVSKPGR